MDENGKWNGLMAALVSKKFDMVLTSLKVIVVVVVVVLLVSEKFDIHL